MHVEVRLSAEALSNYVFVYFSFAKVLDDGTVEVGVHIADVSFFVRPGTALDAEAKIRSTTVYMQQFAVPMLPHMLCEQLCSLNPGVDRYAFSTIFR